MASQRTPKDIVAYIEREKVDIVDLRFPDFPGQWQHFSVPAREIDEEAFEKGIVFDASCMRGSPELGGADLTAVPLAETAFNDPFLSAKTLVLLCELRDPVSRDPYSRDPRGIARRAEAYLKSSGIGDTAYFGPKPEFFIFDDIRFDQKENSGFYNIDSTEGRWNTGRPENPNLGHKPRFRGGCFPVPPSDTFQDLRSEMILILERIGILTEAHHHEASTGGQCEIDLRFAPLLETADNIFKFKYVVKNTARKFNKSVTFMPKPLYNENGNGMHLHLSLWKDDVNLFAGDRYGRLSETALHAVGGILSHMPSLLALTCPTTNSYKRLVPGFEAPVLRAYSYQAGSTALRIPVHSTAERSRRIEFRCPDPACNPYIAFAAILLAMTDGIRNGTDPGPAFDRDRDSLRPDESAIPMVPATLGEALAALREDHRYLLEGGVFTGEFINEWVTHKMDNEVRAVERRPHPWEFSLYYDA